MNQTPPNNTTSTYAIDAHTFEAGAMAPGLYVVATPIGHLGDITLRALSVLAGADAIACEDTRVTGKLLHHYAIATPMSPYHEHNAARQLPKLMARLADGAAIALVSDAGTPLLSDPGYRLVGAAIENDFPVIAVPGASALLAGLVASGLETDTVLFAGFLPPKQGARRRRIEQIGAIDSTIVLYETPRRVGSVLADMAEILGNDRRAVIARELTKSFESLYRGSLADLRTIVETMPKKGELVLLLAPPTEQTAPADEVDRLLLDALSRLPASAAAREVAASTGVERQQLYRRALAFKESASSGKQE